MSEAEIQRMIFDITTRYCKEALAKDEEIRIKHGSKGTGKAL
ncbi:hypothetical protein ACFQ21_12775 [Ohtaekwangia kribbensis]|uniref:Uncharacterized protein n=1 Tax=Ohtaekwangia kribbensis TaxID=688913 RepID=A0ABW3K1N8_9BACT